MAYEQPRAPRLNTMTLPLPHRFRHPMLPGRRPCCWEYPFRVVFWPPSIDEVAFGILTFPIAFPLLLCLDVYDAADILIPNLWRRGYMFKARCELSIFRYQRRRWRYRVIEAQYKNPVRECESFDDLATSSLLFNKLTVETRNRIWAYVLGERTVLLHYGWRGRLHKTPCGVKEGCRKTKISSPAALLVTCRRIYSESLKILYANSTIRIAHNETLQHLSMGRGISSSAFNSITSLQICFQVRDDETFEKDAPPIDSPWDAQTWSDLCRALSDIESLQSLEIAMRGPFLYPQGQINMLDQLHIVRQVPKHSFLVRIPWPRIIARTGDEPIDRRLENRGYHFEVTRPGLLYAGEYPDDWGLLRGRAVPDDDEIPSSWADCRRTKEWMLAEEFLRKPNEDPDEDNERHWATKINVNIQARHRAYLFPGLYDEDRVDWVTERVQYFITSGVPAFTYHCKTFLDWAGWPGGSGIARAL